MLSDHNLIIITDLDGSLLDHHTYSFADAQPALDQIRRLDIPLILNSSKTASELLTLRSTLGNNDPFVVENGTGIFIPNGTFSQLDDVQIHDVDYMKKTFGLTLDDVIQTVHQLRDQMCVKFIGFSEMTTDHIMQLTGLDQDSAYRAKQRDFTEPVVWQDTEAAWEKFKQTLADQNITAHRGGRFIHFSGGGDKGQALNWLRDAYARDKQKTISVIALGDGENDLPMLREADYPVIIRSPVNPLPELSDRKDAIITEQTGPSGWNTAILNLLQQTGKINHG